MTNRWKNREGNRMSANTFTEIDTSGEKEANREDKREVYIRWLRQTASRPIVKEELCAQESD